ncbi:RagB/SusD family nutrient uptake outer membrane protein [Gemmatimonadota bacterium]
MKTITSVHRPVRRAIAGSTLLFGSIFAACDTLLEIENPAAVEADFLEQPENAQLLVTSAITDFECAIGHYVLAGAMIGNEMWDSNSNAAAWAYDRRSFTETGGAYAIFPCYNEADDVISEQLLGLYLPLSTARSQADLAVRVLSDATETEVPSKAQLLATAHAYAGYSRLLLGEGMCSAAIDAGPELSSQQLFALAEQEFTNALNSTPPTDIENMALVGRARARLNQGNTAGALADAQLVPPGFVKNAGYSAASNRSGNKVYRHNTRLDYSSVEDDFHNLEWKGVPDPRVPVTDMGRLGRDSRTPYWRQDKYPSMEAPIPIARYVEAQLIIAEIEGGQTAVDIINALHAAAGIPSYDPATDGPILDQVILERERELFLESHHLYDIIRFNKPLLPAPETPYSEAAADKGGFYGSTVCLPLPLAERNSNPNIP